MAAYTLYFSDPNKTNQITVPDTTSGTGINNYDTSLDLVGSGYNNYGSAIAQNFLKLLENFSGPFAPEHAIEGQLWYDTRNSNRKILRVNNGSATSIRWRPVSGIYQQSNDPVDTFSSVVVDGDIWADTASNQVKLRFADKWTIIGPPTISGSLKAGSEVATIQGTDNIYYNVIFNWAGGQVVEIISYDEFTPKQVIDGFYNLKKGSNLTNKVVARYNGIAEKAFSLQTPSGVTINANEVLKNNATIQTHTGTFVVESGLGLIVKNSTYNKSIKLYNDASSSNIELTNSNSTLKIKASSNSYISLSGIFNNIGINTATTSASSTLDVNGSGRFLGTLTVTVLSTITNSIITNGKVQIGNSLNVGNNLSVSGQSSFVNQLTLGNSSTVGTSILNPALNDSFDIGTTSTAFRNLYVSEIGTTTTFTTLYGHVVGTADKLTYPRNFQVSGHVNSPSYIFDGSASINFTVAATPNIITDQNNTSTTTATQTLLIYNTVASTGLEKIRKDVFLSDIYPSIISTGMIMAYSTSTVPTGYLLCDGTSYSQITYNNLYSVIGDTYGSGIGTFNIPDLTTATNANGIPVFYIIKV